MRLYARIMGWRTETGKTSTVTEAGIGPRQSLGELTFPAFARHWVEYGNPPAASERSALAELVSYAHIIGVGKQTERPGRQPNQLRQERDHDGLPERDPSCLH